MAGPIARAAGAVLVVGVLTAPALALDPGEQARWQVAADRARITLLVPETPGYALQQLVPRSLTCNGGTLGQALATWAGSDGRALQLIQGRPFACGDRPESALVSRLVVSGKPALYSTYDTDTETIWVLTFERDGTGLDLEANFDGQAILVAIAESVVPVAPSPGRELRLTELTGRVVKTVGADAVVVRSEGRRQVVRLIGLRAPQPARGGRGAGCRFAPARTRLRRALPPGASVFVATDPLRPARDARGRLLAYVSRLSLAPYQSGAGTVNHDLIAAGVVRAARGRYRYRSQLAEAEARARRADAGLFGPPVLRAPCAP